MATGDIRSASRGGGRTSTMFKFEFDAIGTFMGDRDGGAA
jgi:hypothetical protein